MQKFIAWNVNGLRAVAKKGFLDFVAYESPDALLLQEIKARPEQLPPMVQNIYGYFAYFNPAQRPGYSGVATYVKEQPLSVKNGMGVEKFDIEGRVLTLEYDEYFLVNVYVPNAKSGLERLDERQEWDRAFLQFLKGLELQKPVIVGGDFNVAHEEIDLARPEANRGHTMFTDEERRGFHAYLEAGFIDTFRHLYPDKQQFSWWTYRSGARARNIGWRIDYFLISQELEPRLIDAFILDDVHGSDHCPVGILLE